MAENQIKQPDPSASSLPMPVIINSADLEYEIEYVTVAYVIDPFGLWDGPTEIRIPVCKPVLKITQERRFIPELERTDKRPSVSPIPIISVFNDRIVIPNFSREYEDKKFKSLRLALELAKSELKEKYGFIGLNTDLD